MSIDQLKDDCPVSWLELNRGRKANVTNSIIEHFLCQQKASWNLLFWATGHFGGNGFAGGLCQIATPLRR